MIHRFSTVPFGPHCVISRHGGEHYQIRDLDSRFGTFVNDVPVRERRLEDGDRIRVCGSLFLFSHASAVEASDPSPSPIAELER